MTKGIEEFFDLEPQDDVSLPDTAKKPAAVVSNRESINEIDRATRIVEHDQEVEDVRTRAMTAFDDIMRLGQNVDPRQSARMFEVAGQMLRTGLDASNSKVDAKLKAAKIKVTAAQLQIKEDEVEALNNGAEIMADRNSLIQQMLRQADDVEDADIESEKPK